MINSFIILKINDLAYFLTIFEMNEKYLKRVGTFCAEYYFGSERDYIIARLTTD